MQEIPIQNDPGRRIWQSLQRQSSMASQHNFKKRV
jgi:hypothetical protein